MKGTSKFTTFVKSHSSKCKEVVELSEGVRGGGLVTGGGRLVMSMIRVKFNRAPSI